MGARKIARKVTAKVRSAASVDKVWKEAEKAIAGERKKRERSGETFTSVTRDQYVEKLKRVKSPVIIGNGWSNTAPPSGTINYSVTVQNPDPVTHVFLAVSVTIGNRNPIVSNDEFLTTWDTRFPTYAKQSPIGFSLGPGATTTISFSIRIPAGVEKTGYFGNTVLQQIDFHDVGTYFDRACFFFEVV
ncbi:MAG TPA: hypothetical protein VNA69_21885 [Thermoanaerobaculia bacterium]|nr:hypothetical protein [Thermoanaerobaculia bacterium]